MKTINREWFVILKESEVESCKSSAQVLVYMAIKSHCGNGKFERGISLREISKRSKFSVGWTKSIIDELKTQGLVSTHGTELRRGGSVEVFSVGTEDIKQDVPSMTESVPPVIRSVPESGINYTQSNKGINIEEMVDGISFKRDIPVDKKSRAGVKVDWDELSRLSDEARAKEVKGGRNA